MRINLMLAAVAATILGSSAAFAATTQDACEASKLKVSAAYASCRLKAEATAVSKGETVDYSKCASKFDDKFQSAEDKAGPGMCETEGDLTAIKAFLEACEASVSGALNDGDLGLDPLTCNADLEDCNDDLDLCEASVDCSYIGIAGTWTLSLPDAYPSPDTCTLNLNLANSTTVNSTIFDCGYLGGANASGTLTGNVATAAEVGSAICSGYRLAATLTFASCSSGSGSYDCFDGTDSVVFHGTFTATR